MSRRPAAAQPLTAVATPSRPATLFRSFFLAGFECSTHRLRSGRRLDLVAATAHDRQAAADYGRLIEQGIRTAREGLRWHRIERVPGRYDFSCELPRVHAARDAGVQVIWDLCHYGWPDDLDPFGPAFVDRFRSFAGAFASLLRRELDEPPWYTPVNEISFVSWIAGTVGHMHPFGRGRGDELKRQLVRAAIAAQQAIAEVDPRARFVHAEPIIHIDATGRGARTRRAVAAYRDAQFRAWDAVAGRAWPELGGDLRYLDVIGVNFYPRNQWVHDGPTLERSDPRYRPLRELLTAVWERYRRPLFVAETGTEGDDRPDWLAYVAGEVKAAREAGVPVEGICLYPILNHPGWDDDRHCCNGLWDYADAAGNREIFAPLAEELSRQRRVFEAGFGGAMGSATDSSAAAGAAEPWIALAAEATPRAG